MIRQNADQQRIIEDPNFRRVKDMILKTSGLTYYTDKEDVIADRIGRRLKHLGLKDCATYLDLVSDGVPGQSEFDSLIADLTVGETHFFRYPQQFDSLRDIVLPACIERNKRSRCLRIWSAGCATGPEPYSVAILLKQAFGDQLRGWHVTILGTDINREFLAQAQEARFTEWALRGLSQKDRESCFSQSENQWCLKDEYREWVSFQYHNLIKHPVPSLVNNLAAFDIILCRNVMIYFNEEVISSLTRHFRECLLNEGWLLVGHAEPRFELNQIFAPVSTAGATIYQKTNRHMPSPAKVDASRPVTPDMPAAAPGTPWFEALAAWKAPDLGPPPSVMSSSILSQAPVSQTNETTTPSSTPPSAEAALAEIMNLANCGELAKAIQRCRKLIETDKLNPNSYFCHALILEQMGARQEAIEALQRVVYLDRNFPLAHYHLGLLTQAQGDMKRSKRHFNNVLAILSKVGEKDMIPSGDGMIAGELKELTHLQLEIVT